MLGEEEVFAKSPGLLKPIFLLCISNTINLTPSTLYSAPCVQIECWHFPTVLLFKCLSVLLFKKITDTSAFLLIKELCQAIGQVKVTDYILGMARHGHFCSLHLLHASSHEGQDLNPENSSAEMGQKKS